MLTACGGGAAPPAETAHAKASTEKAAASPAKEDDSESSAESESLPAATACNDSMCFTCGSGYCPIGWYCDESGSGGAACSWLPECGKASSCGCVTKALGKACSCRDDGGGAHVTCK